MPPVIECCVRNLSEARERRLRDGDGAVRVRPCLEHCDVCRTEQFVVVDGELRAGDEWGPDRTATNGDTE